MNIFILSTGRCGSTTFIKACSHITNFTSAHESRSGLLGDDHFNYPENHIEADNRLSWLLGRLNKAYGDNAIYIHLKRNDNDTARSCTKRYSDGIIKAYRGEGILLGLPEKSDPMSVALDYCHTVNSNIEVFLKIKSQKMEVNLENIDQDFTAFWELIGAKGDLSAALAKFNINYNSTDQLKRSNKGKRIAPRALHKLKRLIIKFPDYIKHS